MIQIDMPMPERCGVCFAMHEDEIGLESWCGIDETARDLNTADIKTKRPEWCPLKEQEATMVIESENMYTGLPITHCPKCGVTLDRFLYGRQHKGQINYCPMCGQAIKWE
jgi:hypothetical protein